MRNILLAIAFILLPTIANATSVAVQIKIGPGISITFSPTSPVVSCNAVPGTVVTTMTITGSTSGPTISGSTDFALSSDKTSIVVAPVGIAAADCGTTQTVTITAN